MRVKEGKRAYAFQGVVSASHWLFDAVSVPLPALVVRGMVSRLRHLGYLSLEFNYITFW